MLIRKYKSADVSEMARLFYETVHAINIRDYTQEQLNQWASGGIDLEKWSESFLEHLTYVAIENNIIVETTGYSRNQIFTFQKYTDLFLK